MIFDVCVPSYNIVFEYQGYQHFFDNYIFGDAKSQQERDKERNDACISQGIHCIEVPYWWRRDRESIVAVLHKLRPDILPFSTVSTPFEYGTRKRNKLLLKLEEVPEE